MKEYQKAEGLSWTKMNDCIVILDTREGRQFHEFDEVATFLWEKMDEVDEVQELIKKLTNQYDVEEKTAQEDIQTFFKTLKEKNLIL